MPIETLKWIGDAGGVLELIDQRLLPLREEKLRCETVQQLFEAIQTLTVRGAPAIGVSAAFGVCLGVRSAGTVQEAMANANETCDYLAASRPTAVNLFWALERMRQKARDISHASNVSPESFKKELLAEALAIQTEDQKMCLAIGQNGQDLIPKGGGVLTHCNAGALATAGIGTALAPMYAAHQQGKPFRVFVDETRPLLQGARLTAWELTRGGIDAVLICDNMAATLMQSGKVDLVITGADRIAANGDAANKIGTLGVSILAKHFGVPFYIAAPSSTFDLSIDCGEQIPIEQRSSDEVAGFGGTLTAPKEVGVFNPAFDVTPAENIAGIITEKGLIELPNSEKIAKRLNG
jgi:methylthioribose-1-phosphate isomerase